jgi:glycosyltransferase involved in cell wall biosynthesis
MGKNKKEKLSKYPFVSICMPTFNRRPFIPFIIKCFENQTYPKDRMEWIIIDDGTDKIQDLLTHVPQVKYFKYDHKMTLGKKRNLAHEMSSGEIIVNMDDDDYYPPERVQHAVDTLKQNPKALCAGSSEMYIYFKHIGKMYQFGPYGPNHSTAATFAFRRELLTQTKFQEDACVAEEKHFLKNYTIPFVQLNSMKSILVFSHNHNSFDKKTLLDSLPNPFVKESTKMPSDFVKEPDVLQFFMNDIDDILNNYEPGDPINKPDVNKQLEELKKKRNDDINEQIQKQKEYNNSINKIRNIGNQDKLADMTMIIQELTLENNQLKDKVKYLEEKMKILITEQIQQRKINV